MKKLPRSRKLLIAALAVVLALAVAIPAFAGEYVRKDITVAEGGIDIYKDGVLQRPTNVKGDEVQPFIYDGTTYLPVRAIARMYGIEVNWEQSTRTIYLGEKPVAGTHGVRGEDIPIWDGSYNGYFMTGEKAYYQQLKEKTQVDNGILREYSALQNVITWRLDGNYKYINGTFKLTQDTLQKGDTWTIAFYNVDNYGEETLLDSYTLTYGDAEAAVQVDVTTCNFVRVKVNQNINGDGNTMWNFYNITGTKFD